MNGKDFITELSQRTGLSQSKAKKVVHEFWDIIEQAISQKDSVLFLGTGTFKPREQTARVARNPQTREAVMLKPRTTVVFKPSFILLDRLNKHES